MGMFDSLYDSDNNEWQTKAFGCALTEYNIGDRLPALPADFQVEVFGGPSGQASRDAYATIRGGVLIAVPVERDASLPLMDYYGRVEVGA